MPGDSVAWALLYTYMIYLLLPLRLSVCLILSILMAFVHLLLVGVLPKPIDFTENQLGANVLLFICANLLGCLSYFFLERRQRRAFLETRQSLEAKLVLEEESQEQILFPERTTPIRSECFISGLGQILGTRPSSSATPSSEIVADAHPHGVDHCVQEYGKKIMGACNIWII
ncbi:uncharacterized protein NPIL_241031 [Nephila pilipes]|uniref:Adenylate cyclase N-terminal domain-containing protein n=1 Tax=Nephila pilipes TaxID=299642 RepID=A0A8X6N513_NEPPI|nr:uncharacterized protein NPIL_241031 [Nephila pilipes]